MMLQHSKANWYFIYQCRHQDLLVILELSTKEKYAMNQWAFSIFKIIQHHTNNNITYKIKYFIPKRKFLF